MSALQSIVDAPRKRSHFAIEAPNASPRNPPVLAIKEPKEFLELSLALYVEAGLEKKAIIRKLNWGRPGGLRPAALFRDIRKLAKLVKSAKSQLDGISETIPSNMRVDVPTVRVGWIGGQPNAVASVSDIDDIYEQWIERSEQENASADRVAFLRQERVRKITELMVTTEACLEQQKLNGYWAARVSFNALDRALSRAIYVICHTRPKSIEECDDLLAFIAWQCATKNRHVDELCSGLVLALARRVRVGIQQFKKGQ